MPKAKSKQVKTKKKEESKKKDSKQAKIKAKSKTAKPKTKPKKSETNQPKTGPSRAKKVKAVKKAPKKKVVKKTETNQDLTKVQAPSENKANETLARVVIEDSLQETKVKKPLKKLKTQPKSMEELLEKTGYHITGLKKGQEIAATISDKNKRAVFFDIGAKTEGILVEREMEWVEDYINFLEIGDTVLTTVVAPENDKGQILLSLSRAATEWKWKLFGKYLETGEEVEVRGLDINKGGMIARLMNVRGFIPVSQFGRQWVGKLDQLYNKVFKAKVIEVDREKNRLIFSEKAVSESAILDRQKDLLNDIKVGQNYKGQVSGVMPFGIFVRVMLDEKIKDEDAGFLDGLVHISEISWEKVNDVTKLYEVGDVIDVQVMDVDKKSGKLNLSIKRLSEDPWEEISSNYPVDTKAKGKVTRLAAFGAFVEIEKGIEGLIHISKIPSDMDIKAGDEVDVYIESLDKDNHRISLGVVLSAKPVGYK